jgi:manganese transport protein
VDSLVALNAAWLVNSAMLVMSAAVFFRAGVKVASIEAAHSTLAPVLGSMSSMVFAIALLCAGISSSTTGTFAGQVVMEGFLQIRIKAWIRRLLTRVITMIPALIAVAAHVEPLKILVLSQVILSFQLPFATVPLIMFTRRRSIMGEYANGRLTNAVACVIAALIIALNGLLIVHAFGGNF